MSDPVPPPPRPGESTAGTGFPNDSFTGNRRDVPAPREFIPAISRDLSGLVPVSEQKPEFSDNADLVESLRNFFPDTVLQKEEATSSRSERSAISAELASLFTAFEPSAALDRSPAPQAAATKDTTSLQSLANALIVAPPPPDLPTGPPPGPHPASESGSTASLLETTRAAQFSLADLAGRLSSKLNTPAKSAAIDLLENDSIEADAAEDSNPPGLMMDWDNLVPPVSANSPVTGYEPVLPDQHSPAGTNWNDLLAAPAASAPPLPTAATELTEGANSPQPDTPSPRALPLPARPGSAKAFAASPLLAELPEATVEDEASDLVNFEAEPRTAPAVVASPAAFARGARTSPPPMPVIPPAAEPVSSSSVLILILGGAALAVLGIVLACTLPMLWLNLKGLDEWSRQVTWAAIIVRAALAAGLMILGLGSLLQKRWAAPLIHASGWVGALFSSLGVAGITWHWAGAAGGEQEAGVSSPQMAGDFVLLIPSLAISLILILLYQRAELQESCGQEDHSPRWTDALPVPGVMVFVSGLVLLTGGLAMLAFKPAFPLLNAKLLTGSAAAAMWVLLAVLGATTAFLTFKHHRGALWVLSAATAALVAGPAIAGLPDGQAWSEFIAALGNSAIPAASSVPALLAVLYPFPFILVLAMARRAFPSPSQS